MEMIFSILSGVATFCTYLIIPILGFILLGLIFKWDMVFIKQAFRWFLWVLGIIAVCLALIAIFVAFQTIYMAYFT